MKRYPWTGCPVDRRRTFPLIHVSVKEVLQVSLISRLRAVVAGDDYLDGDLDDLVYDDEQQRTASGRPPMPMAAPWPPSATATPSTSSDSLVDPR